MKRKRMLAPMLLVALLLGLATGAAFARAGGTDPGASTTAATDTGTTTDPGTTTTPTDTGTTTDPGTTTTTDPGTTTAALGTTSTPTDTTTTSTDPTVTVSSPTSGSNGGTVGQGADQANVQAPPDTTTTSSATPTCSTGPGTSCGNNAATQIALITQQCSAASNVTLTLTIANADGSQPRDIAIQAPVQCNNIAQITQVVRQYCVNCTLVVRQYQVTNVSNTTSTTVVAAAQFAAYCMPKDKPVMRGDGTAGWLVFLPPSQALHDALYAGAAAAQYDPRSGFVCPNAAPAALPATFTLTVPSSLIGQYINLCLQSAASTGAPVCHSIKIDNAATVTIPVSANLQATVTKQPLGKSVASASKGFLPKLKRVCAKSSPKGHHKPCKPRAKTTTKGKR